VTVTDTIQRSATDAGADKSAMRGRRVLRDPRLNRGTAFSAGRLRAAGSEVMATATDNICARCAGPGTRLGPPGCER
jgi:hypothetical protein